MYERCTARPTTHTFDLIFYAWIKIKPTMWGQLPFTVTAFEDATLKVGAFQGKALADSCSSPLL